MLLLIDNCNLLQLVYSAGYSQQLLELEKYVNLGHIKLLTHDLIIQEWEKHKSDDQKRKTTKLLKNAHKVDGGSSSLLPSPVPNNLQHLDSQYAQIEALMYNAIRLTTPEHITQEFGGRVRNNLAPTHNKKNSLNDWEIIGSACNYCEISGIQQLYFVSHNTRDFGSPADLEGAIHPDIQSRFPKVEIKYFSQLAYLLRDISSLILPQKQLLYNIVRNERFTHKASVKLNDIDSLFYLFKDNYEEIAFIPMHILRKYFPFANATNSYTYYSLFNLHQVRAEFVDLLENIEIKTDRIIFKNKGVFLGIKNVEEKVTYIFRRLTTNLIFNLSSDKGHKAVSVMYRPKIICDCIRCEYQRLNLHKSIVKLKDIGEDLLDKLKIAYLNYQHGNYNSAARRLLDLKDEAFAAEKYLIYYLCLYNLNHLGNLLSNPLLEPELMQSEINALKEIDPLEECVKLKSYTDYDFLAFIADGDFFKDALDTVINLVAKLEDHYYSNQNGGWGSNSYVWQLIQEFAVLDSFINNNCIVYDAFTNFDQLFGLVTKGLFASHALKNSQSSHFKAFDNYWVSKFILYGDKKTMYKYFNRYKLTSLTYIYNQGQKDSFMNLSANLLKNEKMMRVAVKDFTDKGNRHFYKKYHEIFDNLMTMATLLDLSKKNINKFSKLLLNYLKTEKSLSNFEFDSIASFIKIKGNLFESKLLDEYLSYFSTHLEKYGPEIIEKLLYCYSDESLIGFNYSNVIDLAINGQNDANKQQALNLLVTLFEKLPKTERQSIVQAITDQLCKVYDFNLFYYSTIYELIPLNKKILFRELDQIDLNTQRYSLKNALSGKDDQYHYRLDALLNICFKFRISLKSKRFKRFQQFNSYYNWVLNMEDFNYDIFEFEWVNHYKTDFYYEAMSRSKKLKKTIVEFLRKHSDAGLERALLKISYYVK